MKQIDWENEREKAKRNSRIGLALFTIMMLFVCIVVFSIGFLWYLD